MPKKITLTPKDCLYIEDIVTAMAIAIKKTQHKCDLVQDKKADQNLNDLCSRINTQIETLVSIMEGSAS